MGLEISLKVNKSLLDTQSIMKSTVWGSRSTALTRHKEANGNVYLNVALWNIRIHSISYKKNHSSRETNQKQHSKHKSIFCNAIILYVGRKKC